MTTAPYDARSVANLMLDEANRSSLSLTNLAVQKLLYFAHALHLIERKLPLMTGYFEAWQFGPVHPSVYSAFRSAGAEPIRFRARKMDVLTGETSPLSNPSDPYVTQLMQRVLNSYGRLSTGRLVDISHAKNAPWDYIVNKSRVTVALGMRIPDDVIMERFRFHKVTVDAAPRSGEPLEDSPIT